MGNRFGFLRIKNKVRYYCKTYGLTGESVDSFVFYIDLKRHIFKYHLLW